MSILIFANGDVEDVDWLRPLLEQSAVVMAANGGSRHLLRLDHAPDLIIGDLDSLPEDAHSWVRDGRTVAIAYKQEKDETDLELALLHAVEKYEGDIIIVGAIGGRLDQTLGNVMLLAHPALGQRHVELVTEHQRAWLVNDRTTVPGEIGDRVSLIPIGGDAVVRATSGLKWPLDDDRLSMGAARGISNVMTAPTAEVILASGSVVCIHIARDWQR